jgi:hypothetical protein
MSEEVVAVAATGLRVEFVRCGDRYAHRVVVGSATSTDLCCSSWEGDADQAVPPSPAYREIHEHVKGEAGSVLGVGMSGTNHWSLAVDVGTEGDLQFDIACRWKGDAPPRLFCTYELDPRWNIQQLKPHAARLQRDDFDRAIVLEWMAEREGVSTEPGMVDRPVGHWEEVDTGLRLVVAPRGEATGKATVRWRYRISAEPCDFAPDAR